MIKVLLPELLSSLVGCRCYEVEGPATVMDALSQLFRRHSVLELSVLTTAGSLRDGVTLYVDGREVCDRVRLSEPLSPDSEIRVAPRFRRHRGDPPSCQEILAWRQQGR